MTDDTYKVTAGELRLFVEQIERQQYDMDDIKEFMKETYAELKSAGYDPKVIRKLVALRKRDKDDVAEEDAIMSLYMEALGV